MYGSIYRCARILKWTSILGNRSLATLFVDKDGPLHLMRPHSNQVVFGQSEIAVTPGNMQLLANAWPFLDALAKAQGATFSNHNEESLKILIQGVTCLITTHEEAIIINEVFGEKIYGLVNKGPAHIVDIGVNVGITSVFFATQPWVRRITGFEPLKPTYEKALEHFAMNPTIAEKITLENFGLANSDRELSVEYSATWKGSVGIGATQQFVKEAADRTTELMQVRKSSVVFDEIIASSAGEQIFVKMDCEGAEYEILEDLAASGAIKEITAFMIEWHDLGSAKLVSSLLDNGFTTQTVAVKGKRDLGTIYAVNTRQR